MVNLARSSGAETYKLAPLVIAHGTRSRDVQQTVEAGVHHEDKCGAEALYDCDAEKVAGATVTIGWERTFSRAAGASRC